MTTDQLAELLDQYLASSDHPPAYLDDEGIFTIDMGDKLRIGAVMLDDGRLELFGNPGHVSADTLQEISDDEEFDDEDFDEDESGAVPGALVRWQAHDAQWGIHVDHDSGLVTLTEIAPQLPWHQDGLATLLKQFEEEHASWAVRLEPEPVDQHGQDEDDTPAIGLERQGVLRG